MQNWYFFFRRYMWRILSVRTRCSTIISVVFCYCVSPFFFCSVMVHLFLILANNSVLLFSAFSSFVDRIVSIITHLDYGESRILSLKKTSQGVQLHPALTDPSVMEVMRSVRAGVNCIYTL